MTRRLLIGALLAVLAAAGLGSSRAAAADKAGPLEVTYYYLPG
jgi:ABC-type glycerol-3-phosphate transport system substrate-binding protein